MVSLASFMSSGSTLPATNRHDFNLRDEDYDSENDFEADLDKWNRFRLDEINTVKEEKSSIKLKSNDTNNNQVEKQLGKKASHIDNEHKSSNGKTNERLKENLKISEQIPEEPIDDTNPFYEDMIKDESKKDNSKK